MAALHRFLQRWIPATPDCVRTAYLLSQYERLARQVPLLYGTIILLILVSMFKDKSSSFPFIQKVLPLLLVAFCLTRLVVWRKRPKVVVSAKHAARTLARAKAIAAVITLSCSGWCLSSWAAADPRTANILPMFLVSGAFAGAFCLSMSRSAAFIVLIAGIGPIGLALLFSGDPLAMAAAGSIAVTSIFLVMLMLQQHDRQIELLVLQASMREQAETDPLTGLLNRRALERRFAAELSASGSPVGPSLIVLDLDGFKSINDNFGHAVGDAVLHGVASRLIAAAGEHGVACRLGGDEFAVLLRSNARLSADVIASGILGHFVTPIIVDGRPLRVGASIGVARWGADGTSLQDLLLCADRMVYVAKTETRAANAGSHPLRRITDLTLSGTHG